MSTHSSTLAWKTPWMEEPGRLWSMGLLRVGHDWETSLSLFTCMHWRRKWQTPPVFAWRIPGMEKPGGLLSMGSHRVRHDWSDLAAMTTNEKSFMYLSVPCISSSVKRLFIFFHWFFVLFSSLYIPYMKYWKYFLYVLHLIVHLVLMMDIFY